MSDQELAAALAAAGTRPQYRLCRTISDYCGNEFPGCRINGDVCHPTVWVRHVLRVDRQPARELVDHAQALHSSRTPTGSEIEAALPATAQALQTGALSPAHVQAIHAVTTKIPFRVDEDDKASAEQILVDAATVTEPRQILRLGQEILARLDPDGAEPKDDDPIRPPRFLRLWQRGGRTEVYGELDAEAATVLTTVLEPLARRRSVEANGGVPDTRMPEERCADALIEAFQMATSSPDMPTEAGEPVALTVTIPLAELEQRARQAMLTEPTGMSVEALRRKACDANLIPAVLGSQSEVLDIGRKTRIIPTGIRRALTLRDKGCAFPGCDRRPKACHAHHVRHWADGGPTALNNLVLLCGYHHYVIHHGHWTVHMRPDGHPEFIPPEYVDPQRRPRRNLLRMVA